VLNLEKHSDLSKTRLCGIQVRSQELIYHGEESLLRAELYSMPKLSKVEYPAAGGQWGFGTKPQLPEANGDLEAKPPETGGRGAKIPAT